ncbi:LPXTG cell wall anchor domain-containing protein [Bacillus sp. AFS031507]
MSDKANSLPITASNTYNYLIFGLLLVTAGSVFVLIRRKRV